MDQGRAAARNMLGKDEPYVGRPTGRPFSRSWLPLTAVAAVGRCRYRKIPFFWTAQYGKSLRYAGNAMQWDSIIVHGNMDAAEKSSFVVYYMNNDLVRHRMRRSPLAGVSSSPTDDCPPCCSFPSSCCSFSSSCCSCSWFPSCYSSLSLFFCRSRPWQRSTRTRRLLPRWSCSA